MRQALPVTAGRAHMRKKCHPILLTAVFAVSTWSLLVFVGTLVHAGEVPLGHSDFVPSPERPVGWRGDGTGCFPGANPPPGFTTNDIRWRTHLPSYGYSSPLVVKDRVFVACDPDRLLCLSASDGKILWERRATLGAIVGGDLETQKRLDRKIEIIHRLSILNGIGMKDDANVLAERQKLERQLGEVDPELADLTQREAEQKQKKGAPPILAENLYRTLGIRMGLDWWTWIDSAFPTPTSDGIGVYAVFAYGQVVCYDLEGNRIWATLHRLLPEPKRGGRPNANQMSTVPSPLLIQGILVVQQGSALRGYRASDGQTLWEIPYNSFSSCDDGYYRCGTPVSMRLGDITVIVTARGWVIRLADGRVLANDESRQCTTMNDPIPLPSHNIFVSVAYNRGRGMSAWSLTLDGDRLNVKELWHNTDKRGNEPMLWFGNRLFGIRRDLIEINYLTGQESRLGDGPAGHPYRDVLVGGSLLFVQRQYSGEWPGVVRIGDKPTAIGKWTLPKTRPRLEWFDETFPQWSAPLSADKKTPKPSLPDFTSQSLFFFHGEKIFARTVGEVMCIQRKTP